MPDDVTSPTRPARAPAGAPSLILSLLLSLSSSACLKFDEEDAGTPVEDEKKGASIEGTITVPFGGQSATSTSSDELYWRQRVADAIARYDAAPPQEPKAKPIIDGRRSKASTMTTTTPLAQARTRWTDGEIVVSAAVNSFSNDELNSVLVEQVKRFDGSLRAAIRRNLADMIYLLRVYTADGKRLDNSRTAELVDVINIAVRRGVVDKRVRRAAKNIIHQGFKTPDDPFFSYQWHYGNIRLTSAWDITVGDDDLVIAVLDSGAVLEHEDIIDRFAENADGSVSGYDFVSDTSVSLDEGGWDPIPKDEGEAGYHGSHVAGTIGATSDNQKGVAGVTWLGRIQPIRVLGKQMSGGFLDILAGLVWSLGGDVETVLADVFQTTVDGLELDETPPTNETPARVVNMSLGGDADDEAVQIWAYLLNRILVEEPEAWNNPTIVVAAGNSNKNAADVMPANDPRVITVGATDYLGQRASYSNYGDVIDIMAPGGDLSVDVNGDNFIDGVLSLSWEVQDSAPYLFHQGTSMAAPHVSGVAALMLSVDSSLTHTQIKTLLKDTADESGICNVGCGDGWLDATKAVQGAGGEVPEEPKLSVDRVALVFPSGETILPVGVYNLGNADLDVTFEMIGTQASLFSIPASSTTIPPQSVLSFEVGVDRADLESGYANLRIQGQNDAAGQEVFVDVLFNDRGTPASSRIQQVRVGAYIKALDGDFNLVGDAVYAKSITDFTYTIEGLSEGKYFIFAVGDDDNDGEFDAQTESFGAYPTRDEPLEVTVHSDFDEVEDVDFALTGGVVLAEGGTVGSPCSDDDECTFDVDAFCLLPPDFQGGYCARECSDGYCGAGGSCEFLKCIDDNDQPYDCPICLARCTSNSECRTDEDYVCDEYGTCTPSWFE